MLKVLTITEVIVECVGVSMDLQVPLLIIDRRGVSIMSALFANRRVAHLRDTDIHLEQKFHAERITSTGIYFTRYQNGFSGEIVESVFACEMKY